MISVQLLVGLHFISQILLTKEAVRYGASLRGVRAVTKVCNIGGNEVEAVAFLLEKVSRTLARSNALCSSCHICWSMGFTRGNLRRTTSSCFLWLVKTVSVKNEYVFRFSKLMQSITEHHYYHRTHLWKI